jgi:transcriptional regulator with XRE-family HTH domain
MNKISLKAARVDKNITQTGLAKLVKVTKKTVASWESGKSMPKADKIDLICQAIGRGYDEIRWKV